MVTTVELLAIVDAAIAGNIRMRVYPDGLVSPHIQDYDTYIAPVDLPFSVDLPISRACGPFISGNGAQTFNYWEIFEVNGKVDPGANTDSGEGVNNARTIPAIRAFKLCYNTDLPTPLDNSFFVSGTLNLQNCASGSGGAGPLPSNFSFFGGRVDYIGNSTFTPTITLNTTQRTPQNIALVAQGILGPQSVDILFTQPYAELWSVSLDISRFGSPGAGQKDPYDASYLVFPQIVGPDIVGLTVILNKAITPAFHIQGQVQTGAVDENITPLVVGGNSYLFNINADILPNVSIVCRATSFPPNYSLGSGTNLYIETPNGSVTHPFRAFAVSLGSSSIYTPSVGPGVFVNAGSGPTVHYYYSEPSPLDPTRRERHYFVASGGPGIDYVFDFAYVGQDGLSIPYQGDEFMAVDILGMGLLA